MYEQNNIKTTSQKNSLVADNKWKIVISVIAIAMTSIVGIFLWDNLPAQLPVHFDINGNPDSFMPKVAAISVIPTTLVAIHLLALLGMLRQVKRDSNNKVIHYVIWIVPAVAILVMGCIYTYSMNIQVNVGLLVTIFLGVLFVILGNIMPKVSRNHFFGIRICWTLKDDDNWYHTHRVGGFSFVIGGLLMIFASLAGNLYISLGLTFATVIVPILFSWIYALRHK